MNGFFDCFTKYLLYLAVCVTVLLFFRLTQNIPQHIFRKMLHYVAMTSVPFMILVSESWVPPVLIAVAVAAAAYPLLALTELCTKNGNDTYTVPAANCLVLALLAILLP